MFKQKVTFFKESGVLNTFWQQTLCLAEWKYVDIDLLKKRKKAYNNFHSQENYSQFQQNMGHFKMKQMHTICETG